VASGKSLFSHGKLIHEGRLEWLSYTYSAR
jgi:hypothetical protein